MTKYGSPAASPALSTPTMCGCCSPAESRISRLKRSTETDGGQVLGQHLHRDAALQRVVERDEHARHAAAAELTLDGVGRAEGGWRAGRRGVSARTGSRGVTSTIRQRNAPERMRSPAAVTRTDPAPHPAPQPSAAAARPAVGSRAASARRPPRASRSSCTARTGRPSPARRSACAAAASRARPSAGSRARRRGSGGARACESIPLTVTATGRLIA